MTTDDRRGSPSEDLVRKAQESLKDDPSEIPAPPEPPELSGEMARTEEPAAVPEPRQRYAPASAPPATREPEVARPDAPVDYRRGLVFAVLAAAVGAVAWALILAYAEIQSWLLGIGIGYLIGLAAFKGAGKVSNQLLAAAIALTFVAVIVGEVLGTAMLINKDFGIFDIDLARRLYFDNLGGDFAFALGAAAVGSFAVFSASKK